MRIARLEEAIAVLRGLHGGAPFDFAGEHYRITAMTGLPTPARPIPLMIGGSGPRMLALAARCADTVAINLGMPYGARSWRQGPTPYADITDRKLDWIRAAAGERLPALELQTTVYGGGITDGDPAPLLAPLTNMLQVQASELAGSPHVLAGTQDECIAAVRGWRSRWGISYVTVPAEAMEDFAPVVAALRGR